MCPEPCIGVVQGTSGPQTYETSRCFTKLMFLLGKKTRFCDGLVGAPARIWKPARCLGCASALFEKTLRPRPPAAVKKKDSGEEVQGPGAEHDIV